MITPATDTTAIPTSVGRRFGGSVECGLTRACDRTRRSVRGAAGRADASTACRVTRRQYAYAARVTPQDLVEFEQIKRLKYRYVRCLDLKLFDEIRECFVDTATASYG